ncbi:MAG: dihydroneopterin aldolase, partial [Bacteroidota bacterium]
MGTIRVNGIKVFAHHGCMPEEEVIGGHYVVDVAVDIDFTTAAEADDLSLTVDYVLVSEIVHREMSVRSKLIESVALRILSQLRTHCPDTTRRWVRITKISAPM